MSEKMPQIVRENFLLKRIWREVHVKKKNFCFNAIGSVGDGKSWGSMRLLAGIMLDEAAGSS